MTSNPHTLHRRFTHLAAILFAALALLITHPAVGQAAPGLALSADTVSDGDVQTITLNLAGTEIGDTVDVYLLLSGPAGSLRSLKADGTFTASGMVTPRLSGVSLKEMTELVTLRLTGLPIGAHKWTVALTKPGAGLGKSATSFSVGFTVKKSAGPLFAELAEGREGGAVDASKRRALASEPMTRARGGTLGGAFRPSSSSMPTPEIASPFPTPSTPSRPEGRFFGASDASAATGGFLSGRTEAATPHPTAKPVERYAKDAAPADEFKRSASAVKKMPAVPKPKAIGSRRAVELAAADDAGAVDGFAAPAEGLRRVDPLFAKGKAEAGRLGIADAEEAGAEEPRVLGEAELKKAAGEIQKAKTLTAGATDDNKDFGDFLTFLKDRNSPAVMCQDIAQRRFITVLDSKGRHVSNADVAIKKGDKLLFAGRTLANGQTLFCPATVPELKAGKHTLELEVAKGLVSRSWSVELEVAQDEKLTNKFDPKQMPEQPMPIDVMPLPGCACCVGLKPMARDARAAAAPAALRALEAAPVAISVDALGLLGEDFAAAYKAASPHVDGKTNGKTSSTLDAVPGLASEREKTVPKGDWVLRLPGKLPVEAPKIDLVFQIDTTGSMRDEIRAVQATLQSVAKRIDSMDPKPTVRWGLVLYGDRGDTYVVRRYSFTPDVNELHEWVLNMAMTGGGDTPESALEALHASVNEMAWDSGDAIRLVFLIADAPPHLDYKRPYTYVDKMKEAVAKGIKIIPTAASGLDKTGEYIFRQWAQGTMGKFLYITYGAGGAGGKAGTTDHEVAQPKKKNNLDDLIVKAVADELANWRSPTLYDSGEKKIEQPKFTVGKAE